MGKARKGVCVYCGSNGELTSDHVPPRCVFPLNARKNLNLVTVPACNGCNNGAKLDDEEFKLYVSMAVGMGNPSRNVLLESVQRTLLNNHRLNRRIAKNTKPVISLSNSLLFPRQYQVTWETDAIRRVICRTIRGLYWQHNKKNLPPHSNVSIYFPEEVPEEHASSFLAFYKRFASGCTQSRIGNQNEFIYMHRKARDKDECSFWVLLFYERFLVFGFTDLD